MKTPKKQKCEPKVYTESEFRSAVRTALARTEKHRMEMTIGSFALALHRTLNLTADQICDVLIATNEFSFTALGFQEIRQQLIDETGLDLDTFTDVL